MVSSTVSKGRKAARPAPVTDESAARIEAALAGLQVMRSRRLVRLVDIVPVLIIIATILVVFALWFARHALQLGFLTSGLMGILAIVVVRELFARFPRMLSAVWRRRLLRSKTGGSQPDLAGQFLGFIQSSEQQLNSRVSHALGVALLLMELWLVWPFAGLSPSEWVRRLQDDPVSIVATMFLFLSYYTAAYIGGLVLWRVGVIARRVSRLGMEFEFNLQVEHPDGCGGFRPVGDLCLTLAYILAPFLLLIGGWLAAVGLFGQNLTAAYLYVLPDSMPVHVARLQMLAVLLAALSVLAFFQPLTSIHEGMSRSKARLQEDLDQLSDEIHQTSTDLRTQAETLTAAEGHTLEEKIDFLQRIYNRNMKIPTWPVNYEHLWRLVSIQVAPAIGVATSGLGLVSGLLGLFK